MTGVATSNQTVATDIGRLGCTTVLGMLAMTLEEARTIAVVVVIACLVLAIVFAWLMKTVAQKVALAVILGLVALLVWTQRSSLDECADKVREGGVRGDTTCSFFGRDVRISTGTNDGA